MINDVIEKIALAHHKSVEELTIEQFSETLGQTIKSGDFMRHVVYDNGVLSKQGMTYMPFRELENKKSELFKYEMFLDELIEIFSYDVDCGCVVNKVVEFKEKLHNSSIKE